LPDKAVRAQGERDFIFNESLTTTYYRESAWLMWTRLIIKNIHNIKYMYICYSIAIDFLVEGIIFPQWTYRIVANFRTIRAYLETTKEIALILLNGDDSTAFA